MIPEGSVAGNRVGRTAAAYVLFSCFDCLSLFRLPVSVVLALEAEYGFHVSRADQTSPD